MYLGGRGGKEKEGFDLMLRTVSEVICGVYSG